MRIILYGIVGGFACMIVVWFRAWWAGNYIGPNNLFGAWLMGCLVVSGVNLAIALARYQKQIRERRKTSPDSPRQD